MKWHHIDRIPVKRRARVAKGGIVYKDKKTGADMKAVADAYDGEKYDGPVRVYVHIFKPLPKGTPKRVESYPFDQRPDIDNIFKAFLDGLNGVAYHDDKQVIEAHIVKYDRSRDYGHEWCAFAVEPIEY